MEREAEDLLALYDNRNVGDREAEAALDRAHDIEGRIAAAPAHTIADVLVKLRRLARHEAGLGGENSQWIHSRPLYESAVAALERLAERGAPAAG